MDKGKESSYKPLRPFEKLHRKLSMRKLLLLILVFLSFSCQSKVSDSPLLKDVQSPKEDFLSLCGKRDLLEKNMQNSILELLEIAQETDCEKAEKILSLKDSLKLEKAMNLMPIASFKNLKSLTLRSADSGFRVLKELKNLEKLEIWSGTVEDAELDVLPAIESLESLRIENTYKLTQASYKRVLECKNLKDLILILVPYTSIDGIESLSKLISLEIWDVKLVSYEPIGKLTNLKNLTLSDYKGDANFLLSLTTLTELGIQELTENGALKNLKELANFRCGGCGSLEAIKALPVKTSLQTIVLSGVDSLEGIEQFTNLESLNFLFGLITDMTPLKGLIKLKKLNLSYNKLNGDLSAIKDLTEMRSLALSKCNIEEIGPLENLKNLEKLDLYGNDIRDISVFNSGGFTNLKEININDNKHLQDLSPLENLSSLDELWMTNIKPHSFEFLKKLNPRKLFIDGSELDDLEFVSQMTNLEFLRIIDNPKIRDLTPVANLEKLTQILWLEDLKIEPGKCPKDASSPAVAKFCKAQP